MPKDCIRVVIADDHAIIREGLISIMNCTPDITLVGEAGDWPETVKQIFKHRPDVALTDLHMPGGEAPASVSAIRAKIPDVKIVMFSGFDADEEVYQCIRAGACGYLLKGETDREGLVRCIRSVVAGQVWLDPTAAARLAQRLSTRSLTSRENDILQMMVAGKSNKEIGNALNLTEGTVKVHLNHTFAKLGVTGRVAAVGVAVQRGLAKFSTLGRIVARRGKGKQDTA
jgi:two-component system NarL family response regulator